MTEVRKAKNALGTKVERLQEEYNGVPVFDSVVTVRTDDSGNLTGDASGTLIQDIADDLPDTEPDLMDIETLNIAIKAEGDENIRGLIGDITYKKFVYMDDNDKARLVNIVSYLIDGIKRPSYIIDLKTGEVLKNWQALTSLTCSPKSQTKAQLYGGNEKMGKIRYGMQPYCLQFTVDDSGNCSLENEYVRVIDMKQTINNSITEVASFPCDEGYNDEVNGGYSPALDAYFHGTVVCKMFEEWYDRTVLKEKMIIRVHYGEGFENAEWNGVNATFGDGLDDMYPLTSMDILGHEFGHAVVEQGSGLLYYGEMGGIDEAFCDIMGETAETFYWSNDFFIGKEIEKNKPYMREFEIPERDNHSISHVYNMTRGLDPHSSSGIYRRVWYVLLIEQGMEAREAFKVFLYANEMYWHYLTGFYDASCGLLKAAMDLGVDTKPFVVAFNDVDIPECDVKSHVLTLQNNVTHRGVTVSDKTEPVFGFVVPEWAASIIVEANTLSNTGNCGRILISAYSGTWKQEENNNASLEDQGYNRLKFDVNRVDESFGEMQYFMKLSSTEETVYNDVEIKVGYICADSFDTTDPDADIYYEQFCLGQ